MLWWGAPFTLHIVEIKQEPCMWGTGQHKLITGYINLGRVQTQNPECLSGSGWAQFIFWAQVAVYSLQLMSIGEFHLLQLVIL